MIRCVVCCLIGKFMLVRDLKADEVSWSMVEAFTNGCGEEGARTREGEWESDNNVLIPL